MIASEQDQSKYSSGDLARDLCATTGLGMLFAGLWLFAPQLALVVVGGLLFYLAIRKPT